MSYDDFEPESERRNKFWGLILFVIILGIPFLLYRLFS